MFEVEMEDTGQRTKRVAKRKAKKKLVDSTLPEVVEVKPDDGRPIADGKEVSVVPMQDRTDLNSRQMEQVVKERSEDDVAALSVVEPQARSDASGSETSMTRRMKKKSVQVRETTRKRFARRKKNKEDVVATSTTVGVQKKVANGSKAKEEQDSSKDSKPRRVARRKGKARETSPTSNNKANKEVTPESNSSGSMKMGPRGKVEMTRNIVRDILSSLASENVTKEQQAEVAERAIQQLESVSVVMDLLEPNGFKDFILDLCQRCVATVKVLILTRRCQSSFQDTVPLAMYSICKRFGVKLPDGLRYLRPRSQKREVEQGLLEAPLTPRRAAVVKAKPMPLSAYIQTELKQKPTYNHFRTEGEANLKKQIAVTPTRKRKDAPLTTIYSPRRPVSKEGEAFRDAQTADQQGTPKKSRTVASPFAQVMRSPARQSLSRRSMTGSKGQSRMSMTQGLLQRMMQLAAEDQGGPSTAGNALAPLSLDATDSTETS
jgi:hypothetical protein